MVALINYIFCYFKSISLLGCLLILLVVILSCISYKGYHFLRLRYLIKHMQSLNKCRVDLLCMKSRKKRSFEREGYFLNYLLGACFRSDWWWHTFLSSVFLRNMLTAIFKMSLGVWQLCTCLLLSTCLPSC